MRAIKRIVLLLLILVVAFSLTACVCETHTVNITSKGGTATKEQIISKETYDQLLSMGSKVDDLKNEGYTITFFTQDGVECVKATKDFEFKKLATLERYFEELATSSEGANSEKYFKSFDVKSKGDKITITGIIGKPDASTVYTTCDVILNFEEDIVGHTIGEKLDSKTLKLDLMDLWQNNANEEFVIEAGSGNTVLLVVLIVVAVSIGLIVSIVLIIVSKKKNKNK